MDGLIGKIVSGIIGFLGAYLLLHIGPKAKLVYWLPHSLFFNLIKENVQLQTDALTLQNLGRKPLVISI